MLMLEKIGIHTVGIDPKKSRRDFATSLGFEKIVDFTETDSLIKMSPNPEGFCGSIETIGDWCAGAKASCNLPWIKRGSSQYLCRAIYS